MSTIPLPWKVFSVNVRKLHEYFKANLSSNYDGIVCNEDSLSVIFFDNFSSEDRTKVNNYWNNSTPQTFELSIQELIQISLDEAIRFGKHLIVQAAVENIEMGINQAGKAKEVADLFCNLQYYLTTGSLYAAIAELERILDEVLDPALEPFVTAERVSSYKTKIETYLAE